jgi:hypothetical protein
MNKQVQNFSVVSLAQQDVPVITEDVKTRYNWVPFGVRMQDDFFPIITMAFQTSTTNAACIEGISDLIFGKGLYTKNEGFSENLAKLIPQEELRRAVFDLKLYGNGAFQIIWNDEHTKIVKFYHIPVQTLRAEKIYDTPQIQNYFYCTDWYDMKKVRDKKVIPAFGTSTEKREILYIKGYTPGKYYYSTPDWISALQFSEAEAELSNLHINQIENGFLPAVMVNMNNGVPAPEERDTIEDLIERKFTGTRNAGRFMISFNDDVANKPTVDVINIDSLHEKYKYVAEYAQDRILVAHRITSPLLFGIRTANNGFSSQSEEMKTAFSIMQSMTISPFQNLILNTLDMALREGGYSEMELYFEQATPLVILSQQAEEQDKSVEQVEDETNEAMENPATTEEGQDQTVEEPLPNKADEETFRMPTSLSKEYEIYK